MQQEPVANQGPAIQHRLADSGHQLDDFHLDADMISRPCRGLEAHVERPCHCARPGQLGRQQCRKKPHQQNPVGDDAANYVYTLANNNYSGNTTVNGGTLKLGQPNLSAASTVTVASGAILELDFGVANTVGSLILGGVTQPAGVYDSTTGAPYITGSGSLLVVSSALPTLNVANLGGGHLQYSWTGGGTLQAQTNSLSAGLGTNWVDYPGASPVTITINPAIGSVFYRVKQ